MADKENDWSQYNPQPVTPEAGAHPDQGAVPAASEAEADQWAKFSPAVSYEASVMPPAMRSRLMNGGQLGSIADQSQEPQDGAWHSIWEAMKQGASAGFNAQGLQDTFNKQRKEISDFVGPNGDQFGGWSMLESGVEAFETYMAGMKGAFTAAAAGGATAVSRAAGRYGNPNAAQDAIEMVSKPYSPDIPGVADIASQVLAFELPPAIISKTGQMSRIMQDKASGKLVAEPIGPVPGERDFKVAASQVSTPATQALVEKKLKQAWDLYGQHPNEVMESAARSPVMAADLNAAHSPVVPVPVEPTQNYLSTIDHTMHKLAGAHQADISEFWNHVRDAKIDAEADRRLYSFGEQDPLIRVDDGTGQTRLEPLRLTPAETQLYRDHIEPYRKEQLERYERISNTDLPVEEYDPTYMHRMRVGKTPEIDRLAGEGSETATLPQEAAYGSGLLSRHPSAVQPRTYFTLVDEAGNRRLVRLSNEHKSLRSIGKFNTTIDPANLKPGGEQPDLALDTPEAKFKVGNEYTIDGKQYTLANAWTREIEENTGNKYYKSAFVSTYNNTIRLRSAERAIFRIQQMRDTPEWAAYTQRYPGENRIAPEMPMFRNDYMHPKMAHIFDDFHGQIEKNSITDFLERVNNKAIGSLFWTPVPHGFNEASFNFAARAWDNFNPKSIGSVMMNGTRALHEVVTQGPMYQEMMREAGSLHLAPIINRDFYTKFLDKIGHDIGQQPEGWAGYAKKIGSSPVELYNSFMDGSNRVLWATGDMFRMSRYIELRERKGLSPADAVNQIERFTPVYRLPHEIFGDRTIAKVYGNQSLFEFSRYHWDQLRFYNNMLSDLAVGNGDQRIRAAGVLMNMAVMQLILWPALSAMTQWVTGNDNLRVPSFGPGRLAEPLFGMLVNNTKFAWPQFVQKYYGDNNRTFMDAMRGLIPVSPALNMFISNATDRYMWNGRPIREPADVREGNYAAVAGQQAEHTARTLFEPYNVFADAVKWGESAESVLLKNIFGIQENSPEKQAAKARAERYQNREARSRHREGKEAGPLEKWITHLGGD